MMSPMRPNLQPQKIIPLQTLLLQIRKRKKNASVLKNERRAKRKKPLDVQGGKSPKRKTSSQKSEVRGQRSEARDQKAEVRTAEYRITNIECRSVESLSHRGVGLMPYGPEAEA